MRSLIETLHELDRHLITIIANRWDVDIDPKDLEKAVDQLGEIMLTPENADYEWSRLSDEERGVMQMILGAPDHKMPANQFERMYGEIRQMGEDKRKRESPHLKPTGIAEILFYRGLVSIIFDQGKKGLQKFVYVPPDLAKALPAHQTGFDLSEPEPSEVIEDAPLFNPPAESMLQELVVKEPPYIQKADTIIVDDLTTLLAYLQIHHVHAVNGYLAEKDESQILQALIGLKSKARLNMMLQLALEMGMLQEQNDIYTVERTTARQWLEAPRTQQIYGLIEAWQESQLFAELWHVPNLQPEGEWEYDPTLLREALHSVFGVLPAKEWVTLRGMIEEIKTAEADFQRPGGDYDSWYIRDTKSGTYLQGFESWDAVEGATLSLTVMGPMQWLGLVDLGRASADTPLLQTHAFRMTAYGRAWAGLEKFPHASDPGATLSIDAQGNIWAARTVSRYERFQLARIGEWKPASDPYGYHITGGSLLRAYKQGIEVHHVEAFLKRATNAELPPVIQKILGQSPKAAGANAHLQRAVILQIEQAEQMNQLWETPNLRRFLGKRLSPTVVMVREEQAAELLAALKEQGIEVTSDL